MEFEVFDQVHVDLVDEPAQELVGIVVLIVVEKLIACSNSGYKSAMVDDASIPLGC